MDLIKEVGAIAGLAAFLGLAVLILLYFAQARDVRRLRESASFLVEGDEEAEPTAPATAASRRSAPAAASAASAPAQGKPPKGADADAFRRAELARQAEERRRRFEERRHGSGSGYRGVLERLPSSPIAIGGALLLLVGVVFGATRVLGGDEGTGQSGAPAATKQGDVRVAFFNSTAEEGLAGEIAQDVKTQLGLRGDPITNTEDTFETSTVMFEQDARSVAEEIAAALGVKNVEGMAPEIRADAEGARVAVIIGEDMTSGS